MNVPDSSLPPPPFYFPLRHGRYDVAPGLNRLGKEVGGGDADGKVFQIDRTFTRFREQKLASRAEDLSKYVCTADVPTGTLGQVIAFIARRLAGEHPSLFRSTRDGLQCVLTGETIAPEATVVALDALACQAQEDLAIVSASPDGRHWLSALHVCFPNGWAPAEKIGGTFAAIHEPVAGMAEMNNRGDEFVRIMTDATDGLVRFAWGVTFDDRLNHHPARPRTAFDQSNPRAFLRVERQTMWGFPHRGAALFTIRTYLYDCESLRHDPTTRDPLVAALRSMSPESRAYKGLAEHFEPLLNWLVRG